MDMQNLILKAKLLQSAAEIAYKRGASNTAAVTNTFRDIADMFLPAPQPLQRVVVFTDSYGNSYHDASTNELLWKVMYNEVIRREEHGYYHTEYKNLPEDPKKPNIPLEEANVLDGPVAEAVREMWADYMSARRTNERLKLGRNLLEKALESKGLDGSSKLFMEFSDPESHFIRKVESPGE